MNCTPLCFPCFDTSILIEFNAYIKQEISGIPGGGGAVLVKKLSSQAQLYYLQYQCSILEKMRMNEFTYVRLVCVGLNKINYVKMDSTKECKYGKWFDVLVSFARALYNDC